MLKHGYLLLLLFFLLHSPAHAQDSVLQQTVRGIVTDAASKKPLQGVTIVLDADQNKNAYTDDNGYYSINNIPLGRQSFHFSLVGYESYTARELMITSGKEAELNVSLNENLHELKEVQVKANRSTRAGNEFATLSAKSFNVEETHRYAASVSDPARMAMNFAGVSNNGDLDNDIVVRGNSPKGVLWRLEGIEIPNPNHFSDLGNGGGAVSMLNASTLGTSDFYTGAFPADIGSALAGAFDLYFRNGNKDQYEHSFQVGALGTEAATEGPFRKGGQSSYLVEYRYSTLALLQNYLNLGGILPDYQDASFKLNFPTKKAGTFGVFGLGGINKGNKKPEDDSTTWNDDNPNYVLDAKSRLGVAGITHQYFVSKNAYIKTVVSASFDDTRKDIDTLNTLEQYRQEPVEHDYFSNTAFRISVLYNNKMSRRSTIRTGIIAQALSYGLHDDYYDYGSKQWKTILDGNGHTQFYEAYALWKYRATERLTLTGGLHGSFYVLNNKYSIEPRAAVNYSLHNSIFSLAAGMHSKPDHISTYLFNTQPQGQTPVYPNKDLDLLRAVHVTGGYEHALPYKFRMKAELYYQYLYHIPVEADNNSGFSILNAESVFSLIDTKPLVSKGTGQNYGLDLTIERPLANDYYLLFTGSLFRSVYTTYSGATYEGLYDRRYQLNIVGGKEFHLHRNGKSIVGVNGKVLYSGGQRESPIDLPASLAAGHTVYVPGEYFTTQMPYYFRTDVSAYFKVNNKKATHSIQLDVQNVTNRLNYYYAYFDNRDGRIKTVKQIGILPVISYRIDFHR